MKVLVVGSGGREHTLAWACARSSLQPSVTCIPGNGGTSAIAENVKLDINSVSEITNFVKEHQFDLTIIGPEAPLVSGLSDSLAQLGFRVFGPSLAAAKIEGSKAYAKRLMYEVGIPTAEFSVITDFREAREYLSTHPAPIVVKASGLAAGKGALVCDTTEMAIATAEGMLVRDAFGVAGREIVIEECLYGREMSLLAIADGTDYVLLPPSRDFKRIRDNDEGPNTGGMGAFAPVSDVSEPEILEIAEQVFPPVLRKLAEEGNPYQGCLYAGIMMTKTGPNVIEFNCRFGDPEIQAVLPLLKVDALELMLTTAEGRLGEYLNQHNVKSTDWKKISGDSHAVTVVAAMEGYPGNYHKNIPIDFIIDDSEDVIVFHAGTKRNDGRLVTSGGRVLAITGLGETHEMARLKAYEAIDRIKFKDKFFRTDIGRTSST